MKKTQLLLDLVAKLRKPFSKFCKVDASYCKASVSSSSRGMGSDCVVRYTVELKDPVVICRLFITIDDGEKSSDDGLSIRLYWNDCTDILCYRETYYPLININHIYKICKRMMRFANKTFTEKCYTKK